MFCLQCAQFTLASLRMATAAVFTKSANVSYLSQNENINSVKQKLCRIKNFFLIFVPMHEIISVFI
jgi:hypothetical protein